VVFEIMAALQLYSLATPNGQKIGIALEEMGLKYEAHTIDIRRNQQFEPSFLAINPNNKIPALVDLEAPGGPLNIIESGAILIYLAEKSGKFLPSDVRKRSLTMQWLMWQMGGFGPMLGQMGHFHRYCKDDIPYAKKRYLDEAKRLFGVLDKQLEGKDYVIGDEYTIADMAIYPWVRCVERGYKMKDQVGTYDNIERWSETLLKREAFLRGLEVCPWPTLT